MNIFLFISVLVISVVIHEYAHGWTADQLGDPTAKNLGRLTLNPIVHVDPIGSFLVPLLLYLTTAGTFIFGWAKPVPYNPSNLRNQKRDPALVAVAGPLSNLLIAVLFGLCMRAAILFNLPNISLLIAAFELIIVVNIFLAVFNLIPIPPLDGSKLLFAALPSKTHNFKVFLERYGFFILVFLLLFGFFDFIIFPIVNLLYRVVMPI